GSAAQALFDANEYTDQEIANIDVGVQSVVAGTNVTVDNTDPANPIVSASGGGGGGAVDSVNGQTGVVVLDADDIDDTSTTHKFVTSTDLTKLSNLSGTNSGDVTVSDSSEIDLTLTGQQISATIVSGSIDESKLDTSVNASLDLADSAVQSGDLGDLALLDLVTISDIDATGTPSSTTYLRGDGTWATPAG